MITQPERQTRSLCRGFFRAGTVSPRRSRIRRDTGNLGYRSSFDSKGIPRVTASGAGARAIRMRSLPAFDAVTVRDVNSSFDSVGTRFCIFLNTGNLERMI